MSFSHHCPLIIVKSISIRQVTNFHLRNLVTFRIDEVDKILTYIKMYKCLMNDINTVCVIWINLYTSI